MTRHKTKCDWLLYLSVIWPLGRALASESYHRFQTFSRQSEVYAYVDLESLKYIREFCGSISTPLNMTRHKTKCDWLLYLSVIWPLGRALANESYHRFQTFSRQSEVYARLDNMLLCNLFKEGKTLNLSLTYITPMLLNILYLTLL